MKVAAGSHPAGRHRRVEALLQIGLELYRERPDLQAAFPIDRPEGLPGLWHWLHFHGTDPACCAVAREIRALIWPLPPRHLVGRVVGEESDDDRFEKGGLVDWSRVRSSLAAGGFRFTEGGKVLDFGVGCGRILRYFGLDGDTCAFVGADVDADAIAWCRRHLEFAQFRALDFSPPTSFPDEEFSAIYGFSVFSHLPEARHLAWLRELHRISKPGAILVVTVMGSHCARLVRDGGREFPHPEPAVMQEAFPRLEAGAFLFFPYGTLTFQHQNNNDHFSRWDMSAYGSTYVPEAYIRQQWTKWFDVVSWDQSPDGWQDYVTLRRRE